MKGLRGVRGGIGRWRHWIDTPRMPGMAAEQSSNPEPATAQHPMMLHGLNGVLGAGRVEAAMIAEYRAHEQLIGSNCPAHKTVGNHF